MYQKQPKKEAVWGHWEVIGIGEPIFDQKLRLMKVFGVGFPFSWNEALGSLLFDQTSTTQIKKKGTYQKQPKKEAVWGHWEVVGIGEPIYDQKLRPIVA